jgi:hypothetical protein
METLNKKKKKKKKMMMMMMMMMKQKMQHLIHVKFKFVALPLRNDLS